MADVVPYVKIPFLKTVTSTMIIARTGWKGLEFYQGRMGTLFTLKEDEMGKITKEGRMALYAGIFCLVMAALATATIMLAWGS